MNERDTRVVENMARTGMDREVLLSLFSKFPREEVERAYQRIQIELHGMKKKSSVKTNCS